MILNFNFRKKYPVGIHIIKLRQITIPPEFTQFKPRPYKLHTKYTSYFYLKTFKETIVIDRNGVLLDGYTSYLIAKMFGVKEIEVEVR